jgi:hypothetical protein
MMYFLVELCLNELGRFSAMGIGFSELQKLLPG